MTTKDMTKDVVMKPWQIVIAGFALMGGVAPVTGYVVMTKLDTSEVSHAVEANTTAVENLGKNISEKLSGLRSSVDSMQGQITQASTQNQTQQGEIERNAADIRMLLEKIDAVSEIRLLTNAHAITLEDHTSQLRFRARAEDSLRDDLEKLERRRQ